MPVAAECLGPDEALAAGYAVRFVVRHMGNGVDRIEVAEVSPLSDLSAQSSLSGAYQVFPLPCWLEDVALEAGASLGLPLCRAGQVVDAWARAVDDRAFEVFLRRVT